MTTFFPLRQILVAGATAAAMAFSAPASSAVTSITDLSYWLEARPTGSDDDWTVKPGVKFYVEDNGSGYSAQGNTNWYVDPGYGGQTYDAEAIFVELTADRLNIAVITGMAPTHTGNWAPGDIAIDFGYTPGAPSFEMGIVTSSYQHGGMDAGDVYLAADPQQDWNYGIWDEDGNYVPLGDPRADRTHPTILTEGTELVDLIDDPNGLFYYGDAIYTDGAGETNYAVAGNSLGALDAASGGADRHYLIAVSLDLSLFPDLIDQGDFMVHWNMRCNNDWVQVDPAKVPEPAPLLLMLGGLLGLARVRRGR